MDKTQFRVINKDAFKPITLEIDILSDEMLDAFIELFDGWDSEIHYRLEMYKELGKEHK